MTTASTSRRSRRPTSCWSASAARRRRRPRSISPIAASRPPTFRWCRARRSRRRCLPREKPLVVGLVASPDRIVQIRQHRVLAMKSDELTDSYVDRDAGHRGDRLEPKALRPAGLAGDRRDAALDRGDGGGGHRAARGAEAGMRLILASGKPGRAGRCSRMPGSPSRSCPPTLDERAAEQPLLEAGATPEDLALALAMAKAATVSETQPERSRHRRRPGARARRRAADQAGGHGGGAAAAAAALRPHASAPLGGRLRARRRDRLAARRDGAADHAPARAGLRSAAISRAVGDDGADERRRLSARGPRHPALREDRGRLFRHPRPAAPAAARLPARARASSNERAQGLRRRLAGRAFALAAHPSLLAATATASTATISREAVPPDAIDAFLGLRREAVYVGGNVTLPHKEAAFRACAATDAGRAPARRRRTRCGSKADGSAATTPTSTASPPISTTARPDWRRGSTALVIGAGGASRAVMQALIEAGFGSVVGC